MKSTILGCSAGIAKEVYDSTNIHGTSDVNDFYYTCAGSFITSFFFKKGFFVDVGKDSVNIQYSVGI